MVSLLILAAGAAFACGSEGTGGSEVRTYTDTDYGYSFAYPKSWKLQKGSSADVTAGGASKGSVGVFNPDGAKVGDTYIDVAMVAVYELRAAIDDSMIPALRAELESVLADLQRQASDMKVEKELVETETAGMKGYTITYSFSKDGAPATSRLYFLFKGNLEYQLTVQAATANWAADQPIFDAVIASFKPGPAK
jgi:hypothetical protein